LAYVRVATPNGSFSRTSGSDGGYFDGTAQSVGAAIGSSPTVTFGAAIAGTRTEYWSIYADWNQNGTFETSEQVHSSSSTSTANQTATFTVPATAKTGKTRLRVIMSSVNTTTGCGTYAAGET
ncbi:GEVED domain-containing protein, partial [Hymenobacter terrenus]|uniref:GEVED domain-containing protein n=1 Tax=Hymenobacter terrenus TaxID=1629124 RepID=UPI00061961FF